MFCGDRRVPCIPSCLYLLFILFFQLSSFLPRSNHYLPVIGGLLPEEKATTYSLYEGLSNIKIQPDSVLRMNYYETYKRTAAAVGFKEGPGIRFIPALIGLYLKLSGGRLNLHILPNHNVS